MRTILFAMLVAGSIGLLGTSSTFAAPANGAVIGNAAIAGSDVEPAKYSRWRWRCFIVRRHWGYSKWRWVRVCRRWHV